MLRLRPYKNCDAEKIVSWIRDEVTFYRWSAGRFGEYPMTAKRLNEYYDALKDEDHFYEMTAFDESGVVGHMIMRFLDDEKKNLKFGFVIVDDSKRGKGYGRKMLTLALKYAFEILKAEVVKINVYEDNVPAHRCYSSIGFKEVELAEKVYFHIMGEEWNCLELEINKEEWDILGHKKETSWEPI
ncbi:MAG: GNAT family N-acetyltransferase [Lachnospiraceae bacterium]